MTFRQNLPALSLASLSCLTLLASTLAAQEPPKPSPAHDVLKRDVGTWKAAIKMWPPGSPQPIEFVGEETNTLIGGMWVVTEFSGDFGGAKFHGRGQFGYSPKKKKYVGTWIDSMNPYIASMEGAWDEEAQSMTLATKSKDAATGEEKTGEDVVKYVGKDKRVFTMSEKKPDGKLVKVMEITYTRVK